MEFTNPFGSWAHVGAAMKPGDPVPTLVLVQAAISATQDDLITEHAEQLFAELDRRGREAWNETAKLLAEYILAAGRTGSGDEAADRYLAAQENVMRSAPKLATMHRIVGGFIRSGAGGADLALADADDDHVRGATRYLFCMSCGLRGEQQSWLLDNLVGANI